MTTRPDVVVVGAGIVGVATAYFLSGAGATVLVLEREAIGCAASGTAAGILSPATEVDNPPSLDELARVSLRLHGALAPALEAEAGVDVRFSPLAILQPAFSDSEAADLQARVARPAAQGQVRWLDGPDARALEPRLSPHAVGALYAPHQAQVDSYRLTLALARAAELRGVTIRRGQVSGLLRAGRRVEGVRLPHERIAAGQVVLAAGPWTGRMEHRVGWPVPVTPLRGQLLHLQLPGDPLRCCLLSHGSYVLDKGDGRIIAGTTEEPVGFRPQGTRRGRAAILASVLRLAPSLQEAALMHHTACLRPRSGDGLPLLGPVPGAEGLYLATGHGRRGILLGPVSGQVVADLVLHGRSDLPWEICAPARFGGTPPHPAAAPTHEASRHREPSEVARFSRGIVD